MSFVVVKRCQCGYCAGGAAADVMSGDGSLLPHFDERSSEGMLPPPHSHGFQHVAVEHSVSHTYIVMVTGQLPAKLCPLCLAQLVYPCLALQKDDGMLATQIH